jgi:hypothetical protein
MIEAVSQREIGAEEEEKSFHVQRRKVKAEFCWAKLNQRMLLSPPPTNLEVILK